MLKDNAGILLVEDDEVDVITVRRVFAKEGLTECLHVAGCGRDALALLRGDPEALTVPQSIPMPESRPRLILLDLNLPRMGGIEFLQELRADPELHALPVVVYTSSDHDIDKKRAFEHHVAGYFVKTPSFHDNTELIGALCRYWRFSRLP